MDNIPNVNQEDAVVDATPVDDLVYNDFSDRIPLDKIEAEDLNNANVAKFENSVVEEHSSTYEEGIHIKKNVEETLEYARELMKESDATFTEIPDSEVQEVEDKLKDYLTTLEVKDTDLDLTTESNFHSKSMKFERMISNLDMLQGEIQFNLEGILGSIISGFGTTAMALKKLLVSKKRYIDGMLEDIKKFSGDEDKEYSDAYQAKMAGKGEPYYALYFGDSEAIVQFLESSLVELEQGNKINFGALKEYDLPSSLKYIKKAVDAEAEAAIKTDAKTLIYDADEEIKYEMHKILSACVIGKEVDVRYAVKYNVGTAFHNYRGEVPAIDMVIDKDNVKEALLDASGNIDMINGLMDKIVKRVEEIGKDYKDDTEEAKAYKTILNSYVKKYEKAIDGYYDFIEATGKFYIREYEHADNNSIADTIVDGAATAASAVGSAIVSGVDSVVSGIKGSGGSDW